MVVRQARPELAAPDGQADVLPRRVVQAVRPPVVLQEGQHPPDGPAGVNRVDTRGRQGAHAAKGRQQRTVDGGEWARAERGLDRGAAGLCTTVRQTTAAHTRSSNVSLGAGGVLILTTKFHSKH